MSTDNLNDPSGIPQVDDVIDQPQEPVTAPAPTIEPVSEQASLSEEPEETEEPPFVFPAPVENNNATIETPYSKSIPDDGWDDLATTIAMPPDTAARTHNYAELQPNPELTNSEQGEVWIDVIERGIPHGSFQDNMLPAAKREGADYRQRIMAGDRALSITAPRMADDDGPLLTGERGILRVNALLGRGAIMSIPLWHSGFYVTLRQPSETELLDAFQRITENQIMLGRITNGLAFANHAVFDNGIIFDLAMQCLYETSVKDLTTVDQIRKAIKAPDIHMLAWGLACVLYPKGFQYERSIIDPLGKATKVVKEKLNLGACLYTDRSALNDWQVTHMAQRSTGSMMYAQVELYQSHFVRGKEQTVAINDDLSITLKVPTVDEYLNAGHLWVDEMAAAVNKAFTQEVEPSKRNALILDRARATSMRQYVHWIKSFDFPKKEKSMVDLDTLAGTCNSLSGDNEIRTKYYEVMKDYINQSTVSIIAVPQVHKDESTQTLPRFENIIPLDPINVFFSLLFQKIQQIRMRP